MRPVLAERAMSQITQWPTPRHKCHGVSCKRSFRLLLDVSVGRRKTWIWVKRASDKPQLAGRQPSNRGGVPWVRTW